MATKKLHDNNHGHETHSRNEDPITGEPGSHPVGVGVGTAAGAASGAALGSIGGPVGTVVGGAVGGIAGGLAGKGAAEAVNPTDEDAYWRDNFTSRSYADKGVGYEAYQPAYRLGVEASQRHSGRQFEEVEADLGREWEQSRGTSTLDWNKARHAAKDAFDRTIQLREERLRVDKERVGAGEVNLRKEVVTETQRIDVPVEREEVVITRRKVNQAGQAGDIKAEEIRVPVSHEKVHVSKDTVVTEEVGVGKRTVTGTEHVEETLRKEELKVGQEGNVRVHTESKPK